MKKLKNTNFLYFLLALVLTINLMILKKSEIFENLTFKNINRNLLEQRKKDYVCDKAGSRLTDKYKTDYNEESIKTEGLNKAQQSIVDFIRDQKYDNIKPYIKHCAIFIFFLVLDIIFIFLWISYCSCCCCSCCLFKKAKPNKCCSFIFLLISVICNLIVLIVSIIILGVLKSFFSRINGFGCSAYYFIDHIQLGLTPSYSNHQSEWEGINGIISKLENTKTQAYTIKSESNNLKSRIDNLSSQYGIGQKCHSDYMALQNNAEKINNLIDNSFDKLTDSNSIEDLREVRQSIQEAEDDAGDIIYDSMHDHTNKYAKKIIVAIFTLTLIFSLLGILTVGLYFFFTTNIFRIIYIIIWNISMLLMLLSILAGVLFGIIGYVFSDAVKVVQYILSSENLNSPNPIVFESSDKYVSDLINTCANLDGNFSKVIEGGNEINENLNEWKQNLAEYQNIRENIDCQENGKTNQLKGYYDNLLDIVDNSLNLTYNITNITCSFAKNDKNILLNEVDTGGIKGIGLCACSFLVGLLLGISVLAGILFVHKYQLPSKNTSSNNTDNTRISESQENIQNKI